MCAKPIIRRLAGTIAVVFLMAAGACSDKLETGYQPKPLDMGLSQRESLYSSPFSEQAQQADQDQNQDNSPGIGAHRPGQY